MHFKCLNQFLTCHLLIVFFLVSLLCCTSQAFPNVWREQVNDEVRYEQCFYQSNNRGKQQLQRIIHGQCMSTNGPDGCCLEGYYKPGICSNLGHLCCIKPDPDCSNMRNNKDIARQMIKQRREHFKIFVKENSDDKPGGGIYSPRIDQIEPIHHRFVRSYNYRIRVNFEIVEMPAYMQLDAVSFATEGLDQYKGDTDEAANHLCQMLDQKYREKNSWACFIGNKFGFSLEPTPGKYMLFYIGNVNRIQVVAFVPKTLDPENQ